MIIPSFEVINRSIPNPGDRLLAAMLLNTIETLGWLHFHGMWIESPCELPDFATCREVDGIMKLAPLPGVVSANVEGELSFQNKPKASDVYREAEFFKSGGAENLAKLVESGTGIKCGSAELIRAAKAYSAKLYERAQKASSRD